MSEYQYYEFQAIDRPLSESDRRMLRDLSTRARITATSFTNSYEWGDFKGDPAKLMERCFDLHLHLANWGSRRLMMRLPARLLDRTSIDDWFGALDFASMRGAGDNLILDMSRDGVDAEDWDAGSGDWDDGSGWLAALAPLRAEVLGGDPRLFYMLWLMGVEADVFADDEPEPLSGLGPLSASLAAFADFFGIDPVLVQAAAERPFADVSPGGSAREIIAAMTADDKTALLLRLIDGDPHVTAELRAKVRAATTDKGGASDAPSRTIGELRERAAAIRLMRDQAAVVRRAAEEKRRAEEAAKALQARRVAIARRGEGVWREIEAEIERRNNSAYDKAAGLLLDLQAVAKDRNTEDEFWRRLHDIRTRHARKERFIERLTALGSKKA